MKKVVLLFAIALSIGRAAVGQNSMGQFNYTKGYTYQFVNHLNDCMIYSGCWHQAWGNPAQLIKTYASNGKAFGIDNAGNNNGGGYGYTFEPTTAVWTKHPEWGMVFGLQADSLGNTWALYNNGNCPANGGWSVGMWNGSTFVLQTYCFMKLALSQDGLDTVYAVDVNGTFWTSTPSGYKHFPIQIYPVDSVAVVTPNSLYVTQPNGAIQHYNNTNGTWTQLPGTASEGYGTDVNIAIDRAGSLYVIGNASNKSVYHWNGSGWDGLIGNGFTSIAVNDYMTVMGVGIMDSQNGLYNDFYRLAEKSVQATYSINTTASCHGCFHNNKVHAGWQGAHTDVGGVNVKYYPDGNLFTTVDQSRLLDPQLCVENKPDCTPSSTDEVICSVAGVLVAAEIIKDKPIQMKQGYYTDVMTWTGVGYPPPVGPTRFVGLPGSGIWSGIVNMNTIENCPNGNLNADGYPNASCQATSPAQMITGCEYNDPISDAACEGDTLIRMEDSETGADDPYVWQGMYTLVTYPDGRPPQADCGGPLTFKPDLFLYKGAKGPTPDCR